MYHFVQYLGYILKVYNKKVLFRWLTSRLGVRAEKRLIKSLRQQITSSKLLTEIPSKSLRALVMNNRTFLNLTSTKPGFLFKNVFLKNVMTLTCSQGGSPPLLKSKLICRFFKLWTVRYQNDCSS